MIVQFTVLQHVETRAQALDDAEHVRFVAALAALA